MKTANFKWFLTLRDAIFGLEDGMVSTLGALTGVAVGSQDHFVVVLTGLVVVAVESTSMGVGAFLSSRSFRQIEEGRLTEEKKQIKYDLPGEKKELLAMYLADGWPKALAEKMTITACKNRHLLIKEMSYRELGLFKIPKKQHLANGVFMFFAYVIGGFVPLSVYLLLPIKQALVVSLLVTLAGLFILGLVTANLAKRSWWRSGLSMMLLAGVAVIIGYVVGWIFK